jgi:hypothetical protein
MNERPLTTAQRAALERLLPAWYAERGNEWAPAGDLINITSPVLGGVGAMSVGRFLSWCEGHEVDGLRLERRTPRGRAKTPHLYRVEPLDERP